MKDFSDISYRATVEQRTLPNVLDCIVKLRGVDVCIADLLEVHDG